MEVRLAFAPWHRQRFILVFAGGSSAGASGLLVSWFIQGADPLTKQPLLTTLNQKEPERLSLIRGPATTTAATAVARTWKGLPPLEDLGDGPPGQRGWTAAGVASAAEGRADGGPG